MFDWINSTLAQNSGKKFMTQAHIYPGNNYYYQNGKSPLQQFWGENFTNEFLKIVEPYQQNHILSIGAHIHHINVFASTSAAVPDINIV